MSKKELNTTIYKKASICLMLPLLVLLFFSCPVKRALNPFTNPTTNAESNTSQVSNTNAFISLHLPCCSHAHKIGDDIAIRSQEGKHLPATHFATVLNNWGNLYIPDVTNKIKARKGFSLHYSAIPVFLRNKAFLI